MNIMNRPCRYKANRQAYYFEITTVKEPYKEEAMKQLQRWLFVFRLIIVVCSTFVLTTAHQTTNAANQPRTVQAQAEENK